MLHQHLRDIPSTFGDRPVGLNKQRGGGLRAVPGSMEPRFRQFQDPVDCGGRNTAPEVRDGRDGVELRIGTDRRKPPEPVGRSEEQFDGAFDQFVRDERRLDFQDLGGGRPLAAKVRGDPTPHVDGRRHQLRLGHRLCSGRSVNVEAERFGRLP